MQEGDILSNTQCACSKTGMKKVFCNMNPLKYYTKDKLSTLKLNKQWSQVGKNKAKCSKWSISNFNIRWVAYEVLKQKPKPTTYIRNANKMFCDF